MQPSLLYHPSVIGDKNFVANVLYNNTNKTLRHVNVRTSECTCFFCSVVFCPEYLIDLGCTTGTCVIEITDFLIKI